MSRSERTIQIAVAILRREDGFQAAVDLARQNTSTRLELARAIVDNHPTKGHGWLEIINTPPLERR
jgi:hypothetical protein